VEEVNFYDPELGISTAIEQELHHTVDPVRLFKAIEEYAEYYAKKCLKVADGEFEWDHDIEEFTGDSQPSDIQLPEHE